jgi:hypothetical protein
MAADLHLQPAEAEAYRTAGYFARLGVFRTEELDRLVEATERVVSRSASACAGAEGYAIDGNRYVETGDATVQFEHRPGSETIRVIEPFHHLDVRLDALLDDPRIVEPMRGILGAQRVSLWTDKINLKRPREGSGFRWHQDSPYWTHACDHVDELPNVMLTLDDANLANGCFRVVRGSHTRGCLPGIEDASTLGPLFTDPACFREEDEVLLEVPAGTLIFFSPHTVHGSKPNQSDEPRRAFVLTYQPGDAPMFKLPGTRSCGAKPAVSP